jgi:aminoglycoside N3'-acetyltransferase
LSKKRLNKKLKNLFNTLGIKKGDKIILHSNIAGILQFYNSDKISISKVFFSILKKHIGKNGTIIIPTYNYEFTKKKSFNLKNSSSEVGFFSNYLLRKYWKKRTLDPVFSHLVFGILKDFNKDNINNEAFGKDSIFSYLLKNNFKVFCFCCSSDQVTFIHFIEYIFKAPYRYIKKFISSVEYAKFKQKIIYKYNVGKKKYDYTLKEKKINRLIDQNNFVKSKFGRFECFSINCIYLYESIGKKITKNNYYLIK